MSQQHDAGSHPPNRVLQRSLQAVLPFLRRWWRASTLARLLFTFLMASTFVLGSWAFTAVRAQAATVNTAHPATLAQQPSPTPTASPPSPGIGPAPLDSVEGLSNHERTVGEQPYLTYLNWQVNDHLKVEVNAASGNLVLHASDLHIQGTGIDLTIERFYNPQATNSQVSGLSQHWNLSVGTDVYLQFNSDGSIIYFSPTGTPFIFMPNGSGGFTSPAGINATLVKVSSDGAYHLMFHKTGATFEFGSGGHLIDEEDKNGNDFVYNETNGQIQSIVDTQGRTTTFTYDSSGRLITITDPSGRKVQYTYDANGNLASSTDTLGQKTTYAYESGSDDLTSLTDPAGHIFKFTYSDAVADDQVASLTDATGAKTTFSYTFNGDNANPVNTTVVTDPRGNQTTYGSDDSLRVTKVTDALGHNRSTQYSPNNDVTMLTDALGNTSQFQFDVNNNITSATEATGAKDTFTYQDSNHPFYPTGTTDAQGNTLAYTYDSPGNLTQVKNVTSGGAGETTNYTYNSNGTIATMTDGDGNKTTYSYDSSGNLIKITPPGPLGTTTLQPDSLSRTSSLTDGKGQTTSFTYDALDRITKITYADGSTISYVYDAAGNVTSLTDSTGATTFTYDAANRITKKVLPGGITLSFSYDAIGNLTAFTDAGGTVNYSYNAVNLIASLTDPSGAKTTYGYDNKNQRTSVSYPNGVTMTLAYDSAGHETSIVAKNSSATLAGYTYTYGTADLRKSMTDQVTGLVSTYHYDTTNRLIEDAVTQGSNQTSDFQYSYDKAGNRASQTINGAQTTFAYNAANELTSTTLVSTSHVVNYTYDGNGNLTSISTGNETFTYNAKDQATSMAGVSMTYTGTDQAERVQAGGTSYVNAPFGVSSQTSSSGTTYFTRESNGTLTSERTPSGTFYYLFDGLGSVVGLTDSSGNLVGNQRYVYDPYGNITNTISSTTLQSNPWRFASGYFDSTSAFTKFGIRYDDTSTGRWTQHTPIGGSLAETTKANPYVCTADNPVNVVDPSGAASWYAAFGGCLASSVIAPILAISGVLSTLSGIGAGLASGALTAAEAGSAAAAVAATAATVFWWVLVVAGAIFVGVVIGCAIWAANNAWRE